MARLTFKERFIDPRSPSKRPRRAAYALPTLFTAGNIFLGFIAILRSIEGVLFGAEGNLGANPHFEVAAKAIGAAVVLDGLDGRIARMTNTVSDFGREMDSLADVITFGIAPAVLAYVWGVHFVAPGGFLLDHRVGYFLSFLFCYAGRSVWRASMYKPIRFRRIRAGPIVSISLACRFPPAPAWLLRSYMRPIAFHCKVGFFRPPG